MQHCPSSECSLICEDDAFSALVDKVCLQPAEPLKEKGCDLDFVFDKHTMRFVSLTEDDNLEPTPLPDDKMMIPLFDRPSRMDEEQAPQGYHFARQINQGSATAPFSSACSNHEDVMSYLGPPRSGNHRIYDSIYPSPEAVSSSGPSPETASSSSPTLNYQVSHAMPSSSPVIFSLSSPIAERSTVEDIILGIRRELLTTIRQRNIRNKDEMLPQDFAPGSHTVIIDRRKRARQAPGNQLLRNVAMAFCYEYANAPNKPSKSRIVSAISQIFEDNCPDGGAFVRLCSDNRWYTVKDSVATEKVGYTMRELLGERYRSSSRGKKMASLQSLDQNKGNIDTDGGYSASQ